jgi:hypothetical protein
VSVPVAVGRRRPDRGSCVDHPLGFPIHIVLRYKTEILFFVAYFGRVVHDDTARIVYSRPIGDGVPNPVPVEYSSDRVDVRFRWLLSWSFRRLDPRFRPVQPQSIRVLSRSCRVPRECRSSSSFSTAPLVGARLDASRAFCSGRVLTRPAEVSNKFYYILKPRKIILIDDPEANTLPTAASRQPAAGRSPPRSRRLLTGHPLARRHSLSPGAVRLSSDGRATGPPGDTACSRFRRPALSAHIERFSWPTRGGPGGAVRRSTEPPTAPAALTTFSVLVALVVGHGHGRPPGVGLRWTSDQLLSLPQMGCAMATQSRCHDVATGGL